MRLFPAIFALLIAAHPLPASQTLPVFLADNHAETFSWITRTFDPDARFHLVLIDAHSDASMAERSEEIREQIRRVPNLEARQKKVQKFRAAGRIQAFNWIEPLMPRPIEEVTWLAAPTLDPNETEKLTAQAASQLDGRLEVEPRAAGSFATRWQTVDLAGFSSWVPGNQPVILSIDLDFFSGMKAEKQELVFEAIWQRAMDWPGLAGVSFAVSRPWLADDAETDALVALASSAVSRTRGATLEIQTKVDTSRDSSQLAASAAGPLPRWDPAKVSPGVLAIWANLDNLPSQPIATITPDHGEPDCDEVWRYALDQPPALRIRPPQNATGRVRWFALEPTRQAYDLLPETGLGKDFSGSPGRWIYEKRRNLEITEDFALAAEKWSPGTPGRFRLEAEIETNQGWLPVPPLELALTQGHGFHAALSECLRMPYAFGIADVEKNNLTAVETGWASDCANLLIYAWRRNGIPLAWGDPGWLRSQLETLAESTTLEHQNPIPAEAVRRGIAIDFGRHVAALWEDREPHGTLDGHDLVLHHLGGLPEIVTLETLARERPVFSLRTPHLSPKPLLVKVAGDVVLAFDQRTVIDGFEKANASLFLANLEGVPSLKNPDRKPQFDFRFPPERLAWLKNRGLDAVSLANNHAGDAGLQGLQEGIQAIQEVGLAVFGAGANESAACEPWQTEVEGHRVAVFGVCLVASLIASPQKPGVAHLPTHAPLLEARLRKAKAAGETIIVIVHGGNEYRREVNATQRKWTRWLVRHGARLIVGAHSHVTQKSETHGGATITHSLGNATYPNHLKGADSGSIMTYRVNSAPKRKDNLSRVF